MCEQTLTTKHALSLFTHFLFLWSSQKKVYNVGAMTVAP